MREKEQAISHLCALSCTLNSCILINRYRTASVIPLQFLSLSPNSKAFCKNSDLLKYSPSQFTQEDSQLSLDILSELTLALSTSLQKSLQSLQSQFTTLQLSASLSNKNFFWVHSSWGNCRLSPLVLWEKDPDVVDKDYLWSFGILYGMEYGYINGIWLPY